MLFQHFLKHSQYITNYIFEMSDLITIHIHVIYEPNTSIKRTKSTHYILNVLVSFIAPCLLPPLLISDHLILLLLVKFPCRSFCCVISPTTKGVTSHLTENPCYLSSCLPHPTRPYVSVSLC